MSGLIPAPVALRFSALVMLLWVGLLSTGCESSQKPGAMRARESSIPWNRPASWEGPGVYGSALGQGR
jgi:hypothetical protein